MRGCGRIERPAFPAPSIFARGVVGKARGFSRRENAIGCLNIKSESTAVVPDERAKASAIRDPYAAASHWAQVSDTFHNHEHRWLWVPAFAGTTAGDHCDVRLDCFAGARNDKRNLAPLAGRRRREATSPGEGANPRVRACRVSPSPARKMLA